MLCTINKLFEEFQSYHDGFITLRFFNENDINYVNDMFNMPLREDMLSFFLIDIMQSYRKKQTLELVAENENCEFLGVLDVYDIHGTEAEIGYRMCKKQRGKGYAKKAVRCVLSMLKEYGMTRIHARSEISNLASEHVLKANGFVCKSEKEDIRYWEVKL